jgi:hypothetical protein
MTGSLKGGFGGSVAISRGVAVYGDAAYDHYAGAAAITD